MARKIIPAKIYHSAALMLTDLSDHITNSRAAFGMDLFDIMHDNLPTITDPADGTVFSALNPDEAGLPNLHPDAGQLGTLAIIPLYSDEAVAQPDADPALRPRAVYVLHLPKRSEVLTDAKLEQYRQALLDRELLARAKAIAARHDKDAAAAPMPRDRVAALLSVASRTSAASLEKAFTALFPIMQAAILANIGKKVDALKAAGQHAQARLVAATFSKQRLNRDTMRECLSSAEAARINFPALPQTSWVSLLNFAIAYAPKHKRKARIALPDGSFQKDAEGKLVFEIVADPQPVTIFSQWLATRDETGAAAPDLGIDLSDMGFTAPAASAA